jgi:protein-serine/threonine kinase
MYDPSFREPIQDLKVSTTTNTKAVAFQQYLKQYYMELFNYRRARTIRQDKIERESAKMSADDKQKFLRENALKESQYLRLRRTRTSIDDFTLLALLGKGGYGEVYLTRMNDTGEIAALKRMKKSRFTNFNQVSRIRNERDVMSKHNSEWLAQLKYSFTTPKYIYLAMEYIPGGDMKALLDQVGCFAEEYAKFFFAEMLLAVDTLHKMGYVHRDLKPDNFLVDRSGHLKLIDFGLSKDGLNQKYSSTFNLKRASIHSGSSIDTSHSGNSMKVTRASRMRSRRMAYSVVGSPEYMAVEVLDEKGYTHLCDYWSLGIIFYELLYGITPFWSESIIEVFGNIMNWQKLLGPPELDEGEEIEVTPDAWDLIRRLLCAPEDRIGRNGVEEIKEHKFFKGFNWSGIRTMEPPFIPELEGDLDTSYFSSQELPEENIQEILKEELEKGEAASHLHSTRKSLKDAETHPNNDQRVFHQLAFKGFTWKHYDPKNFSVEVSEESDEKKDKKKGDKDKAKKKDDGKKLDKKK